MLWAPGEHNAANSTMCKREGDDIYFKTLDYKGHVL